MVRNLGVFPPGLWYDTPKYLKLKFCETCGETTRHILYSTTVDLQTDKSTTTTTKSKPLSVAENGMEMHLVNIGLKKY